MSDVSITTGEIWYSGSWKDIQELLRVLNIGEGRMAQVTQPMVENFQEMIDRDIDAILQDTYQTPIRSYNQVRPGGPIIGPSPITGWVSGGSQVIPAGASSVTISGQSWANIPDSVIVTVAKSAGLFNLYATVDNETITTDGFTATLSAEADPGYILSYFVSKDSGPQPVVIGASTRVFPGDVRRAARYWTAGQILVTEFQQLEANLTDQATQMVNDARNQVYAFCRPTHRIPGQRRKSNISRTMPPNMQPSAFPERPS